MDKRIRVLIAKPGLDGHDAGAKLLCHILRDAGMEVVYTGMRQTPQMIVNAALEENVDVIGLSILSGAHKELTTRIMRIMKETGLQETLVIMGGIIPDEDVPILKEMGVNKVFGPGTDTRTIVDFIKTNVGGRDNS